MLSCTEISFVDKYQFLFNLEKFWVKPELPFYELNRAFESACLKHLKVLTLQ